VERQLDFGQAPARSRLWVVAIHMGAIVAQTRLARDSLQLIF